MDLRRPGYSRELDRYPQADPVVVAQSWAGLRAVRGRGALCLLCDGDPSQYDLSALRGREAWIIRHSSDTGDGWALARHAQRAGATRANVIALEDPNLKGMKSPRRPTVGSRTEHHEKTESERRTCPAQQA